MARAEVTEDYYSILEVSQFASLETIRESYKRLALRFHPDKNRDQTATRTFQRLAIAWETLKDTARRREYDRTYSGLARRSREEVDRRREEVDREVTAHWNRTTRPSPSPDEAEWRQKVQIWHDSVRSDYLLRFQNWMIFRDSHLLQIKDRQTLMRRNHADLEDQLKVPEDEMIQMFQDAIQRSQAMGQKIHDPSATLKSLLEARQIYLQKMTNTISENQNLIKNLISELETARRRYEDEEATSRTARIHEALQLLGPRDLNPPLFSMIDRRGQAINRWSALSRVKTGGRLFTTLLAASEGPWHVAGDWERLGGEYTCERCAAPAFHILLECGPARCPGCGTILCHDCDRDLQLLREYDLWMRGRFDDEDAFFSLEFGFGEGGGSKRNSSNYGYSPAL